MYTKLVSFCSSKINVIHLNDSHGSRKYLPTFIQAKDEFCRQNPNTATFTFCAGDLFVDTSKSNQEIAQKTASVVDAFTWGNHDLEGGKTSAQTVRENNMSSKWLGCNLVADEGFDDVVQSSIVVEKNGEEVGVIGVSPFDYRELAHLNKSNDFIYTENLEVTIELIKKEVKKLEEQGINKIFLLAHTGNYLKDGTNIYSQFAKIAGIDVILGGHDHIETDYWEVNSNGEPVKIAATGNSKNHFFKENLDTVGLMQLVFDDNGVLIREKCTNSFRHFFEEDETSGQKPFYTFAKPFKKAQPLLGHSEIGNLVADSNLWYVNSRTKGEKADFSFVNAGTIRGNIDDCEVSTDIIRAILPFTSSTLIKAPLTKKQIIDTLNWCSYSTTLSKISPGCMQVGGLEYTIKEDLTVSDVHVLNEDGSIKYNLDDFDDDHEFMVVYDEFLATSPAGLTELAKDCENDPEVERFGISRQDALEAYLKEAEKIDDYTRIRIKSNL